MPTIQGEPISTKRRRPALYQRRAKLYVQSPAPTKGRRPVLYQRRAKPYVQSPAPTKGRRPVLYQRRAKLYVPANPHIQGPEARSIPTSIPKVTLLTLDPILCHERPQLLLKIMLRMVRLLRVDIPNQRLQIPRPNGKRTIPSLPRKLRQLGRLTLQPL